jgi:peptidoglycan hydrolase-like protein with peptidoglycan-binding domain
MTAIQKALNGWWEVRPQLVPDGIWGANTARGVRQFQKRVGLPETGQLDAATLQRLGVQTTNAAGNPNSGFFLWSQQARQAQEKVRTYVAGLDVLNPNYQPFKRQAEAIQQTLQQAEAKAKSAEQVGAKPDPAMTREIAQLQAQIAQLTGNPNALPPRLPDAPVDWSKYLLYGGAFLFIIFLTKE